MITALLYNSCTSCRKTEDVLKDAGVEYQKREYFKERFTVDELRRLLASVDMVASDVISKRSRVYKERNLGEANLSDEEILELMVDEPTLIRRPIVIKGDKAVVGHNETKLNDLIADEV